MIFVWDADTGSRIVERLIINTSGTEIRVADAVPYRKRYNQNSASKNRNIRDPAEPRVAKSGCGIFRLFSPPLAGPHVSLFPLEIENVENWYCKKCKKVINCVSEFFQMSELIDELLANSSQATGEGRLEEARRHLGEAVGKLRPEGGAKLAAALRALAEVERKLSESDAAKQHYEEAVSLYLTLQEPQKLAHTIRHLGNLHHDEGELELAENCYQEALDIYRSEADPSGLDLANAIRCLAVAREESQRTEEASRLWQEARDLYRTAGIPAGVAESSARLALLAQHRGDSRGAENFLKEARAWAEKADDPNSMVYVSSVAEQIEG